MDNPDTVNVSRRGFLSGGALAVGATTALAPTPADAQTPGPERLEPKMITVALTINGQPQKLTLDSRSTLLDTLRHKLSMTGTKKGCGHGQCGACTVHVDGQRQLSCFTLMASLDGREVTTIEGLAKGDDLHPMQTAFIENDAFQCGYCTPGQIMSAVGCVKEGHVRTDAEIREYMAGNLCRCAAYPNIVAAIRQAAAKMGKG